MTIPTDVRPHGDRRITILLILSGVVIALMIVGTPFVISTANTTQEVRDASDLNACRSEASSKVTDARTAFDIARSERDTAATELGLLTNAGLQAAVAGDDASLLTLTSKLPAARAQVHAKEEVVVDATHRLLDVSAGYVDAVRLSREDPDLFLQQCKER